METDAITSRRWVCGEVRHCFQAGAWPVRSRGEGSGALRDTVLSLSRGPSARPPAQGPRARRAPRRRPIRLSPHSRLRRPLPGCERSSTSRRSAQALALTVSRSASRDNVRPLRPCYKDVLNNNNK